MPPRPLTKSPRRSSANSNGLPASVAAAVRRGAARSRLGLSPLKAATVTEGHSSEVDEDAPTQQLQSAAPTARTTSARSGSKRGRATSEEETDAAEKSEIAEEEDSIPQAEAEADRAADDAARLSIRSPVCMSPAKKVKLRGSTEKKKPNSARKLNFGTAHTQPCYHKVSDLLAHPC